MTDTELLDFLQRMLDEKQYTGRCVLRWSFTGRGMRLHETNGESGVTSIRWAIEEFAKNAPPSA